jgi:sporulation protein YlmC with PRC-barrel domain
MRLSELLDATVVDRAGRSLGPVRDVRLSSDGLEIVGVVVGGGRFARAAHAWGYAEGRAQGPWVIAALTRPAVRQARFVPSERVVDWGPSRLRLDVELADLPPLQEVLSA